MQLIISLMLAFSAWAASDKALLEDESHCVAYKAEKVVFFVSKSAVIGKNCDVSAQVLPEVGGLYHIEVNIPVRSFKSDDPDRDQDVMKILKAEERPELTFRTKAMTAEEWKKLFGKINFDLEGELFIGNRSFPLKVRSTYLPKPDAAEVDGVARVQFKDFDIPLPTVGGGVLAKAKPELELHFHLQSHRILGADSIRLANVMDKNEAKPNDKKAE
ncbi:MAG: YceI family protein [Bdellovibrionales bacterium]|nr:YceI family protein [Bdellovibrionales bacterium]